ncbi:MAG: MBOAT family protein, partial [Defluviitaleaceae bacterium]|nr:MBOAT family protein [Defluviitaleaceae bacterium]
FLLVAFIRSIDFYDGVSAAFWTIASVFTRFDIKELSNGLSGAGLSASGVYAAAAGLSLVAAVSVIQRKGADVRETLHSKSWPVRCAAVFLTVLVILVFGAYGEGYDARQFIYNQF